MVYKMADKITAKDLAEKKANFILIDVREADEIAEDNDATVEGAVNIPLGQLVRKARQGGLEDLRGKPYALTAMDDIEETSALMNEQERVYECDY
jgi:rhodanese-related sulfurtransferase